MEIARGAGHAARYLHYICPTAMIFIPCKAGISHNETESIEKEHAVAGARVLAGAVLDLADAGYGDEQLAHRSKSRRWPRAAAAAGHTTRKLRHRQTTSA